MIRSMFGTLEPDVLTDDFRFVAPVVGPLGKEEFPRCLTIICHDLWTRQDAAIIAAALHEFFADDMRLMNFADLLSDTSTCCSRYELEY